MTQSEAPPNAAVGSQGLRLVFGASGYIGSHLVPYLLARGIPVRAGIIVAPGSAAFEVMRDLVYHLPIMITSRWARAKSPPIARQNLLEYLLQMPALKETAGGVHDAAGAEIQTYEQMMRNLVAVAERRAPLILPVPVLPPRLSSCWLKYATSVPTNIAQALIGGLEHGFTTDTAGLQRLVPQRLLNFRESVEAAA